eukprot:4301510-Amphidinium_carterae.1
MVFGLKLHCLKVTMKSFRRKGHKRNEQLIGWWWVRIRLVARGVWIVTEVDIERGVLQEAGACPSLSRLLGPATVVTPCTKPLGTKLKIAIILDQRSDGEVDHIPSKEINNLFESMHPDIDGSATAYPPRSCAKDLKACCETGPKGDGYLQRESCSVETETVRAEAAQHGEKIVRLVDAATVVDATENFENATRSTQRSPALHGISATFTALGVVVDPTHSNHEYNGKRKWGEHSIRIGGVATAGMLRAIGVSLQRM